MKTRARAFTLIELLAAISIVGVLTTLGLAATRSMSEKNKATGCLNDLRQVGVALQLYLAENENRFPNTSHQGAAESWTNTLAPFLKTNFLGRCPACPHHPSRITYAWNDALADTSGRGVMAPLLRKPSSTMVVGESASNQTSEHFHFSGNRGGAARITPNQFRGEVNVECHGSGANYLFVDGHAETLTWTEVQRRLRETDSTFLVP